MWWNVILVICIISVLSQLTNTFDPWLSPDVSMSIKASPIGDKLVAPEWEEGEWVFVVFKKLPILVPPTLYKHLIFHLGKRSWPLFGDLMSEMSNKCIFFYLVKLYISLPTDTLRKFCNVWLNLRTVFLSYSSSIYLLFAASSSVVGVLLTVIESKFVNLLWLKSLSWLFFTKSLDSL